MLGEIKPEGPKGEKPENLLSPEEKTTLQIILPLLNV